jgi:hypothetical protein
LEKKVSTTKKTEKEIIFNVLDKEINKIIIKNPNLK